MAERWIAGLVLCVALAGCSADPVQEPAPIPSPSRPAKNPDPGLGPTPVASDPAARVPVAGGQPSEAMDGLVTREPLAGGPASPTGPSAGAPGSTARPVASSATAPFTGSTQAQVREPTGGPFGVRVARVAGHPGYDRVVIELAGRATGAPGWRVAYATSPTSDGSGNPIAMRGRYFLQVGIQGVGYPADTGVASPTVRRFLPRDTKVVQEYVLDSVFEGLYTTYVGLTTKVPYRVFALSNPTRIVVDLRHP